MKKILPFLFIVFSLGVTGQNQNSIWCFGDSAGIDFRNVNNPLPLMSGMDGRGSCVSISDSLGNLIMYAFTKGNAGDWATKILNSRDTLIQGVDSITGVAWYNELVIVQKPLSDSLYYVFSIGLDGVNNGGLYYTLVDMSQNGGLGVVIKQNIQLNNNTMGDCLSAAKHGNGRDWWIISKAGHSSTLKNRFFLYLITPDSIYVSSVQDLGNAGDVDFQKIIFKASGDTFMLINRAGYLGEYLFNRCTGTITLNKTIFPQQTSVFNRVFWFGAYSLNGNVFYADTYSASNTVNSYLIQYDLTASNIPMSADTLGTYPLPIGTGALKLAPDNKIYFSCAYECNAFPYCYPYPDSARNYVNENLGVINNPDIVGSGCGFQPFSFYLGGKRTYYGLPNNPNYGMGPLAGSACDTLTSGIDLKAENLPLSVYPNPFYNKITLQPSAELRSKPFYGSADRIVINVFNDVGEIVYTKQSIMQLQEVDLSGLPEGVYLLQVEMKEKRFMKRMVKL